MSDFQAASEDSSGGIADPPPEGLNLDIECLVDSFVAAGCLSLFKLAEAPGRSKDTFSTIHRGDGCGKPLSQTFSFGGTIRIIWADRDFLASAEPAKRGSSAILGLHRDIAPVDNEGPQSFVVYGLDRRSGNILWQQTAISGQPKVKRHPKSPAIPIPPPLPTAVT